MSNITGYQFPMRNIFPPTLFPSQQNNSIHDDNTSLSLSNALQISGPTTAPLSTVGVVPPPSVISVHPPSQSIHRQNTPSAYDALQRSELPYYSNENSNCRRNRERVSESRYGTGGSYSREYKSDTATAYAVKSAQYPVLYEKLKAPSAARKALKSWKKEGKLAVPEATGAAPALEYHNQNLIEDAPEEDGNVADVVDDRSSSHRITGDDIELQDLSNDSRPQRRTSHDSHAATRTTVGDGILSRPSASTSNTMVVHRPTRVTNLPPQHMTFSEPVLEKTKRGSHILITCTLGQSYPNFHIECEYLYVDKSERVNSSQTDTRLSFASIVTRENIWVVALEQRGYNELFIKGVVGEEEYARLDSGESGPTEGHPISPEAPAPVAKKIKVPEGFDLGGIWCKAAGFYQVKIFIPRKM